MALLLALTGCSDYAGGRTPSPTGARPGTSLPSYNPNSTVGDLSQGFPSTTIPVLPGAEVIASSAEPSTTTGQTRTTLNLRSTATVADLAGFYGKALTAQGFEVSPTSQPNAMASLVTYVRTPAGKPTEAVVVGVFDEGEQRLVTISGNVATPSQAVE